MHVRNNLIAVPLPADKKDLATLFPQHKLVSAPTGEEFLVVPKRMDYALELKRLGLTKAELTKNFQYRGRWKPFIHQRTTVEFLISQPRAFCLNDMGTGKTASCIWAAEFLRSAGLVKRVLIVSLISCMKTVWENEIFSIAMNRTVSIAYGTPDARRATIDMEPEYLIINPDGIKIVFDEIAMYNPDLIIVDEASAYKHHTSLKWKALKKLIQPTTRMWLLTGTPASTSPADVYGIVKLVNPTAMAHSFIQFKNEIMIKISTFKWVPKMNAIETVMKYMQPAIRFDKRDCLDMPPVTYVRRIAGMSKEQKDAFVKMRDFFRFENAASVEPITAINAAVKVMKLLQICQGVVKDNKGEYVFLDAKPRLDELDAILDEIGGNKSVIYAPFKGVVKLLEKHLKARVGATFAIITGDTPLHERNQILGDFQNVSSPQILLAHPRTTSHGITLTASHNTIWYGPHRNPDEYIQANNRQDRPGQIHPVTITHIYADEIELKVYQALASNQNFQENMLQLYAELTD